MKYIVLILLSLLLLSCGTSSGIKPMPKYSDEPGWHEGTLERNGLKRLPRFYIPEELSTDASVAFLLHGETQSMEAIFRPNAGGTNEWPDLAEEEKFLLIVPNGINVETGSPDGNDENWNDCRSSASEGISLSEADDVGFITELINWTESRFEINTSAIYATGSSNGGQMACRLAIERPEYFAAIAVFIGNLAEDTLCENPSSRMPVLMVNGTENPIIPFDGGNTDRGNYLSAPATRNLWANTNEVNEQQRLEVKYPDIDPDDGSRIICKDDMDPVSSDDLILRFCRV